MKAASTLLLAFFSLFSSGQITMINPGTSTAIVDLSLIRNNLLINGNQSYLSKSTDACNTIQQLGVPVGPGYFNNMSRPDSMTVYLLSSLQGPGNLIHKSTDGGNTWVKKLDSANLNLDLIAFFDTLEGIAAGFPYTLYRTKDGGNTWAKDTLPIDGVGAMRIFGDSTIILGQSGSYISKDRGATYSEAGGFFSGVSDFFFLNKDTIFTVSNENFIDNNKFSRSYNGGLTWQYFDMPINYPGAVFFKSRTEGYVIGSYDFYGPGMIFKTADMGQTWNVFNTQLNTHLTQIVFLNDSIALIGGTNGTLFKWNSKQTIFTDIEKNNLDDFQIKLFPNPVLEKLTIEFSNAAQNMRINISSSLGQSLYSLNNVSTKQEIDLAPFAKGIYFLKVQNDEGQKVFKVVKD